MERILKKVKWLVPLASIILLCFINTCKADDELEEYKNVIEKEEQKVIKETANSETKPTINSRRYVIYDRLSGKALYGKDENKQTAMASTTKILTSLIIVGNCDLQETVTIDKKAAAVGGSRLGLKEGDRITVNDLLYGLMLRSGNDAAVALARYVAGSTDEFASLMNHKAKELGLKRSHFVTPHGLDNEKHYTTAYELAKLTDYALKNETIRKIVNTKVASIKINGDTREIRNTNELLGNVEGVYGVKTGFTNNAGRCLVTAVKRGNLDLIIVVLGADTRKDRARDTVKLIEYACNKYEVLNVQEAVEKEFELWKQINQNRIYINKAENGIELEISEPKIKKVATDKNIKIEITAVTSLEAPISKGTRIGTLVVKLDDEILEEIDIKTSLDVKRRDIWDYLKIFAKIYSGKIGIIN